MGKRFGRQQKRALNEQLKAQNERIELLEKTTKNLHCNLRESRDTVQRVADILGQYFVGLPVKTVVVQELQRRYKIDVNRPSTMRYSDDNANLSALEFMLDYLDTYEANIYNDDLARMVHLRYESMTGAVGYGLSETAMQRLSPENLLDILMEQIAPEMARLLIQNMKAKGNSRYMEIS